jgi:uncharacterized protein YlzI (FlbEa/FlbD family)
MRPRVEWRSADRQEDRQEKIEKNMIRLTRLNNQVLTINSDLIKFVEQSPDTLITLINGEKLVVRENVEEVLTRIVQFRRLILRCRSSAPDLSSSQSPLSRCAGVQESELEK